MNKKCSGCQKRPAVWQKFASQYVYCNECAARWRSIGTFLYRINPRPEGYMHSQEYDIVARQERF